MRGAQLMFGARAISAYPRDATSANSANKDFRSDSIQQGIMCIAECAITIILHRNKGNYNK